MKRIESQLEFDLGASVKLKPCKTPKGKMEFFTISVSNGVEYELFTIGTDRYVRTPKDKKYYIFAI